MAPFDCATFFLAMFLLVQALVNLLALALSPTATGCIVYPYLWYATAHRILFAAVLWRWFDTTREASRAHIRRVILSARGQYHGPGGPYHPGHEEGSEWGTLGAALYFLVLLTVLWLASAVYSLVVLVYAGLGRANSCSEAVGAQQSLAVFTAVVDLLLPCVLLLMVVGVSDHGMHRFRHYGWVPPSPRTAWNLNHVQRSLGAAVAANGPRLGVGAGAVRGRGGAADETGAGGDTAGAAADNIMNVLLTNHKDENGRQRSSSLTPPSQNHAAADAAAGGAAAAAASGDDVLVAVTPDQPNPNAPPPPL